MLESRSAYGYYGAAGGFTGENGNDCETVRLPYREYKTLWRGHKTIPGSYDPEDKTIEVIFSKDEMKKKTNLGNRYELWPYYFELIGVELGVAPAAEFKAKTRENALRNAKKYAKEMGYVLGREITFDEYIKMCNS